MLLEQQGVGAEVDVFLSGHDPRDDLVNLWVQERLTSRNRNHRGTAFIDGVQALFHRQMLPQDVRGVLDLPTTGTGEIAPEQWFQHEHQRVTLASGQPLLEQIGADGCRLSK